MMNATTPLPTGPIHTRAATGPMAHDGDDGQAFAQALDQATTRQRKADGEAQETTGRDAVAAPGSRSLSARKAADAKPTHAPDGAPPEEPRPRVEARDEDPTRPATDAPAPPGADLAAWASSLPMPMPAAAAPAADAAVRVTGPGLAAADASAEAVSGLLPQGRPFVDALPAAATAAEAVPGLLPQGRPFVDALPAAATAAQAGLATARVAGSGLAGADAAAEAVPGLLPQGRPFVDALPAAATAAQAPGLGTAASRHAVHRASHPSSSTAPDSATPSRDAGARADAALQGLGLGLEGLRAARPEGDSPAAAAAPSAPGTQAALSALALTTGGTARSADGASPAQAEVRAPLGSPEFAPALGSQLSVMVREGIDHAQLKLNPAEMGPIEVRISLDGTQAQVDFSAAHAATRQALQDAVPALASALRENGLTLTGGGVFDQARDPRGDARQDRPSPWAGGDRPEADGRTAPLPAARATRSRGVVDLYA
jgi:flagellar hook-length control protein FliK